MPVVVVVPVVDASDDVCAYMLVRWKQDEDKYVVRWQVVNGSAAGLVWARSRL